MTSSAPRSSYGKEVFKKRWFDTEDWELLQRPLDPYEFERIRRVARSSWEADTRKRLESFTTYRGQHCTKTLDEPTQCRVRPSSPTRMEKPHPSEVFLVTKLHTVSGYFNSVDHHAVGNARGGSNSYTEPSTSFRSPLKKQRDGNGEVLEMVFCSSQLAQAARAWMNLAPEAESKAVQDLAVSMFQERGSSLKEGSPAHSYISQAMSKHIRPECIVPMNQWLRRAGKEETAAVASLLKTLSTDPQRAQRRGPGQREALGHRASDFQIHPEWVTQPWHSQYRHSQESAGKHVNQQP
ncbi:uncharacterized protein [Lepisosteus oculatus]|uniref:uncharacterized protein isoform X1 n=1 Tax=Lepisosteus oculatus TaxID=7918 RepID=UPI0035F523AF